VSLDKPIYFEGSSPIIIPHRGGSNIVPENTLHGFQMVLDEGFSHYETDLRMTKDGEIVLHHDETLDRTTNATGLVKDYSWSDIQKINAGYKFYKENNIPNRTTKLIRLVDALEMNDEIKLNLDLKESGLAKKVVEIINSFKAERRVLVSSFSAKRLDEFIKVSKGKILTSGSFRENAKAKFLPNKNRNFKVQALQAPFRWKGLKILSKKLVEFCKINKLQLHIWTVNSLEDFQECIDLGCNGVITDEPIMFRDYIKNI